MKNKKGKHHVGAPFDSHIIQGRPENKMYGAVKVLYSYEEVMSALDIVRDRVEVEPIYTVEDMGDGYTVLYYFVREGSWAEYPIDYEEYFTETSIGFFTTFIFLNDKECPGHENYGKCAPAGFSINKYDEDYDILAEYRSYAGVKILENKADVEIVDRSLLSYSGHYSDGAIYSVYYNGENILRLVSCVELNDTFFEVFFENLVTTRAKK